MKDFAHVLVGAVETGGTKTTIALARGRDILSRTTLTTGDSPKRLFGAIATWFGQQQAIHGPVARLGVASFGPLAFDPASAAFGRIALTPKPGWSDTDLIGPLRSAFADIPIAIDTDTNAAALGEHIWGAALGLSDFVYITIGTGIGAGIMAAGRVVTGTGHPEAGHMLLPLNGDEFEGVCPFHGACWEGLCSGPAIHRRTGVAPENLPGNHPAWQVTIDHIACALMNITWVVSPQRIVLGGSVRKAGGLGEIEFFRGVRRSIQAVANGYGLWPEKDLDTYVVPSGLGDDSGILGAVALAQRATPLRS